MTITIDWNNLINYNQSSRLCRECSERLQLIEGEHRCEVCSREQLQGRICYDCERWKENKAGMDVLVRNYSSFSYNGDIKDIVTKWKYRGDYQLGEVFREQVVRDFNRHFSEIKQDAIVTALPLSEARLNERGFNQAKQLADFISVDSIKLLERIHSEKQSKMNRFQRLQAKNPFKSLKTINKPVILVDDIYTTGMTLRHAAIILRKSGCPKVYAYTLIRG